MSELFILDADCFTFFQFRHAQIVARAATVDRLAITIVTVDESLTGWYSRLRKSKTPEELAAAVFLFDDQLVAERHLLGLKAASHARDDRVGQPHLLFTLIERLIVEV